MKKCWLGAVIIISALVYVLLMMYGSDIVKFVIGEKVEYDYCDAYDCRNTTLI